MLSTMNERAPGPGRGLAIGLGLISAIGAGGLAIARTVESARSSDGSSLWMVAPVIGIAFAGVVVAAGFGFGLLSHLRLRSVTSLESTVGAYSVVMSDPRDLLRRVVNDPQVSKPGPKWVTLRVTSEGLEVWSGWLHYKRSGVLGWDDLSGVELSHVTVGARRLPSVHVNVRDLGAMDLALIDRPPFWLGAQPERETSTVVADLRSRTPGAIGP